MGRVHDTLRMVGKAIINPWKTYKEHVIIPRQKKYAEQKRRLNESNVRPVNRSRVPIVPIRSRRHVAPTKRFSAPTRKPVLHRR